MADSYCIHLSHQAADQLRDIFDYIAQDAPQNAAGMIGRPLDTIDALNILPHRYRVVQNAGVAGEEIRSMPVRPYLVWYHVDDSSRTVTGRDSPIHQTESGCQTGRSPPSPSSHARWVQRPGAGAGIPWR